MSILGAIATPLLALAGGILGGNPTGQSFRNKPVPNLRLALYVLVVRGPQAPYPLLHSYIFPISPQNLKISLNYLTNYYDVSSTTFPLGVTRQIDSYGQAPPIYSIDGTTGWQLHGTDGYSATGWESMSDLKTILIQYTAGNQAQVNAGNGNLNRMELYDYFRGSFWQVVPYGEQVFTMDARRPLYQNYSLKFLGVAAVAGANVAPADQISATFSQDSAAIADVLSANTMQINANYGGVTAPSL
jgi:hypothetical protein